MRPSDLFLVLVSVLNPKQSGRTATYSEHAHIERSVGERIPRPAPARGLRLLSGWEGRVRKEVCIGTEPGETRRAHTPAIATLTAATPMDPAAAPTSTAPPESGAALAKRLDVECQSPPNGHSCHDPVLAERAIADVTMRIHGEAVSAYFKDALTSTPNASRCTERALPAKPRSLSLATRYSMSSGTTRCPVRAARGRATMRSMRRRGPRRQQPPAPWVASRSAQLRRQGPRARR